MWPGSTATCSPRASHSGPCAVVTASRDRTATCRPCGCVSYRRVGGASCLGGADLGMSDAEALRSEFCRLAADVGLEGWPCEISVQQLAAPHRQPRLPTGQAAVYVFSLSADYGAEVPAGAAECSRWGRLDHRADRASSRSTTHSALRARWPRACCDTASCGHGSGSRHSIAKQ